MVERLCRPILVWERMSHSDKAGGYRKQLQLEQTSRDSAASAEKNVFIQENEVNLHGDMPRIAIKNKQIANNLEFWIKYSSWTYCETCSSLHKRKLFQRHESNPKNKHETACACFQSRYVVPLFSLIPDCLKNLTFSQICSLRPLNFHYGDYERMQHGYQQKNGMCHVTWKTVAVEQSLALWKTNIPDASVSRPTIS